MKLLYCIAGTCHSGGMERVLTNKANYLTNHGYEVVIVTTDQRVKSQFFPLYELIRFIDLFIKYEENNGKSFSNNLFYYPHKQYLHKKRLTAVLKQEKPDITLSMFCNDAGFITQIHDGSKKVLEIHFSKFKRLQYGRKGLWRWADLWRSKQDEKTVKRFDRFVVLTEEDKGYWGNLPNIVVIPHARTFTPKRLTDWNNKKVIAIGRYNYQKGFERLIEVWRFVVKDFPEWKLEIIGDGEEREKLRSLVNRYGLNDSLSLVAANNEIEKYYLNASLFVLTSRYEGLPMVLLEAQAFGLPIVSFRCKCGPSDVITDGVNGFLVDEGDIEQFAVALKRLMGDAAFRKQMGEKALVSSERFSEEQVMQRWISLFESLCTK